MSNIDTLLASARASKSDPWNAGRSRRVFEGAVRSRAARGRRQRFVAFACAASAALFVLGVHAAGSRSPRFQGAVFQASNDDSNESVQASSGGDSVGISGGTGNGAIAMSSDMFADGGRETD